MFEKRRSIELLPGVEIVWGCVASSVADAWRSDMERIVLRWCTVVKPYNEILLNLS